MSKQKGHLDIRDISDVKSTVELFSSQDKEDSKSDETSTSTMCSVREIDTNQDGQRHNTSPFGNTSCESSFVPVNDIENDTSMYSVQLNESYGSSSTFAESVASEDGKTCHSNNDTNTAVPVKLMANFSVNKQKM